MYLLSGPTSSGMELSLSPLPGRCSLLRDGDSTTSSGMLTSDALVGRPLVVASLSVTTDASDRGDCISVPVRDEYSLKFGQCYIQLLHLRKSTKVLSSPPPPVSFRKIIFIILEAVFSTYLKLGFFAKITHLLFSHSLAY